jgi:hypothetical protein
MNISIECPKEVINWYEEQLVQSNIDNVIVLTTAEHSQASFEGVTISKTPTFRNDWCKSAFKPFKGTITISND